MLKLHILYDSLFILQYKVSTTGGLGRCFRFVCIYACTAVFLCCYCFFRWIKISIFCGIVTRWILAKIAVQYVLIVWKNAVHVNIIIIKIIIIRCDLLAIQWLQASLPVKDGGLGVRRVSSLALPAFLASAASTLSLKADILADCAWSDNDSL